MLPALYAAYADYAVNAHVDVYARDAKNLQLQDISCRYLDPSGHPLIIPCDARHAGTFPSQAWPPEVSPLDHLFSFRYTSRQIGAMS